MMGNSAILLVDKTPGWTSHDVVNVMRGKLGLKKIGHTGTLDPAASGLLILLLDDATKEQTKFLHLPKKYRAQVFLGVETDTWDADGQIVKEKAVPQNGLDIRGALLSMTGKFSHKIPFYSAKKVNGRPMYAHAREGANIERESEIVVYNYENVSVAGNLINFDVFCSSGTYVRSLAVMLANKLGTVGHLKSLRRLSIGDFNVEGALTPEQIKNCPKEEILKCIKNL